MGARAAAINHFHLQPILLNPHQSLCRSIYLHNSHLLPVLPPPAETMLAGLKIPFRLRSDLIGWSTRDVRVEEAQSSPMNYLLPSFVWHNGASV